MVKEYLISKNDLHVGDLNYLFANLGGGSWSYLGVDDPDYHHILGPEGVDVDGAVAAYDKAEALYFAKVSKLELLDRIFEDFTEKLADGSQRYGKGMQRLIQQDSIKRLHNKVNENGVKGRNSKEVLVSDWFDEVLQTYGQVHAQIHSSASLWNLDLVELSRDIFANHEATDPEVSMADILTAD